MSKDDFFSNLRDSDDSDFDFELPQNRSVPTSKADVIRELSIEKNATNINVTVTLNGELFKKIEKVQKELQKRSKDRISKSKVIAKICEHYLSKM